MVSVRPSFGIRGSYFAAALNVIQLVGWTAVMLIVCGQAADAISKFYRIFKPQPLDHSLWSDHNPVGCGGSSILEVAPNESPSSFY